MLKKCSIIVTKKEKSMMKKLKNQYPEEIEEIMKKVFNTLSEKPKRLYAASEAEKLGHGGITYISELFGCARDTIERGKKDLKNIENLPKIGDRRKGGGRKKILNTIEGIDEVFLSVLQDHTAGSPVDKNIIWTDLTQKEISKRMSEKGIDISVDTVKQLLEKHEYRKRKALKKIAIGETENKDEQFEKIKKLKEEYEESGNPILSIDTKKKNS